MDPIAAAFYGVLAAQRRMADRLNQIEQALDRETEAGAAPAPPVGSLPAQAR